MDPTEKFIDTLKSVTLSGEERASLRTQLLAKTRASASPQPSPWSWLLHTRALSVTLLALVIVGSYGGTLTLAAENTLPGDVLYPIKTQITEPLARLTAISPAAQATFETNLLDTRLQEAEALDNAKKLTPPLKQEVKAAVREQTIKAAVKVNETVQATPPAPTPTADVHPMATFKNQEATSTSKTLEVRVQMQSTTTEAVRIGEGEQQSLNGVLKEHAPILQKLNLSHEGHAEIGE